MGDPSRARVTGPLQQYALGFVGELARPGFTANSASGQMFVMAHLSRWLEGEGLDASGLTAQVAGRFLADRRAAGCVLYLSPKALAPLLGYLRRLGAAPAPPASAPAGPVEALLARYRDYLLTERGLVPGTARGYADAVRPFLAGREKVGGLGLDRLTAGEVTAFVLAACAGKPKGTAKLTVTALRSLLGFLHVQGLISEPLGGSVPAVASWRLAGLPKALEQGQVAAMLASCDRHTPVGRRDLAMLTLLAGSGCALGKWLGSAWMTSTGGLGRSSCAAKEAGPSGCRWQPTLVRRSPPIWPLAGPNHSRPPGRCSCGPVRRTAG